MKQFDLTVYTDGSSLGNPGPGGWGALLLSRHSALELGGREDKTTNNRMELLALIKAFEKIAELSLMDYEITVYADSKYVLEGLTKWLSAWKARGWKKSDNKPVLNQDLWQRLDDLQGFLIADNKLFYEHIRGHTGEIYNERVDDIARHFAEGKTVELFDGTRSKYVLSTVD
ncbi:MAG: ribonuclease HI [Patescibacteria group bacterium]